MQLATNGGSHLLAPISMTTSHADGHFSQVSDFLPLEAIQIRLNGRVRILQVLCGEMQGIFQLQCD